MTVGFFILNFIKCWRGGQGTPCHLKFHQLQGSFLVPQHPLTSSLFLLHPADFPHQTGVLFLNLNILNQHFCAVQACELAVPLSATHFPTNAQLLALYSRITFLAGLA